MRVGDRVYWKLGHEHGVVAEIEPAGDMRRAIIRVTLDIGASALGRRSDFSYITEREADVGE